MKALARIRAMYEHVYGSCMLFLAHFDPKSQQWAQEKSWKVPWEPGTPHHCHHCTWLFMLWEEEAYRWKCRSCGHLCKPTLAITEKRPVVQPVQALVPMPGIEAVPLERHTDPIEKQSKPAFAKGQLSFLHRREVVVNGTERLPNGLPRLVYKNGSRIDTEQLRRVMPPYNRRTG